jgi:hypothetical protein
LKAAGFSSSNLRCAGFSAEDLFLARFDVCDIRKAGFEDSEFHSDFNLAALSAEDVANLVRSCLFLQQSLFVLLFLQFVE